MVVCLQLPAANCQDRPLRKIGSAFCFRKPLFGSCCSDWHTLRLLTLTKVVGCHGNLQSVCGVPGSQIVRMQHHRRIVDENVQLSLPMHELLHKVPHGRQRRHVQLQLPTQTNLITYFIRRQRFLVMITMIVMIITLFLVACLIFVVVFV